jgi:hypothetical protein
MFESLGGFIDFIFGVKVELTACQSKFFKRILLSIVLKRSKNSCSLICCYKRTDIQKMTLSRRFFMFPNEYPFYVFNFEIWVYRNQWYTCSKEHTALNIIILAKFSNKLILPPRKLSKHVLWTFGFFLLPKLKCYLMVSILPDSKQDCHLETIMNFF